MTTVDLMMCSMIASAILASASPPDDYRAYYVLASMMGAFCSVWTMSDDSKLTPTRLAGKFVVSAFCGMLFAPQVIAWVGWEESMRTVLCSAGGVSFLGVSTLHFVHEKWPQILRVKTQLLFRLWRNESKDAS